MLTRPTVIVIAGGLAAGAIDIVYAIAFWGVQAGTPPVRILQSVAAGLLGAAAFTGGATTAALGLALHFGIALTVAAVFYLAAQRRPGLVRRPWWTGALYGVVVYAVMQFIVLPLSAAGPGNRDLLWVSLTVIVHAIGIGVPSALAARAAVQTGR